MKKFIALLIITFALAAILPADGFSLSAGGGGLIGGFFTRYKLTADGKIDGEPININADQEMNQFNFGGSLFVDGTFSKVGVELNIGLQRGINNYKETSVVENPSIDTMVSTSEGDGWETMLNLSLLGKYPFTLNERFTLFPLAGVEYQIALEETRQPSGNGRKRYDRTDGIREVDVNGDPYSLSAWNSWFVVIGGGVDYRIFSSLFVRAELLYGFRLPTSYELDQLDRAKKALNAPNPKLGGLTSGPTLSIAAGWRFI